jgi:exopolyphosphatase/guanosine-5'-triphosphate,3'-diphosphate pyrophosphatase
VLEFAHRYAWDGPHCEQVVALALSLFDQTAELHGLGPAERELLEYAGLLHDAGYSLSQSSHHKHSLYLIKNADLDGFTPRELLIMANVARYHRKALPAGHHPDYVALGDDDKRLVRRLGALLRVADGLDADHFQVVSGVEVRAEGDRLLLELTARDTPHLNLWASERNADLFEEEFKVRLEPVATEVA